MKKRVWWLAIGVAVGVLLSIFSAMILVGSVAQLLVVDNDPVVADAVVVLGGGESDRLKRAVKVYDDKLAKQIILVGGGEKNWPALVKRWSGKVDLNGRDYVVLTNSFDTISDARLSLKHSVNEGFTQLVVVTSPYHTRRAQFVFNDIFEGSGISTTVISSGDYVGYLNPDDTWWRDRKTLKVVWLEFGKILYWELTPFVGFQRGEGAKEVAEGEKTSKD